MSGSIYITASSSVSTLKVRHLAVYLFKPPIICLSKQKPSC